MFIFNYLNYFFLKNKHLLHVYIVAFVILAHYLIDRNVTSNFYKWFTEFLSMKNNFKFEQLRIPLFTDIHIIGKSRK